MNRIDAVFAESKKILSPYITAGDPHPKETVSLMHALVEGGADIIELGMPFSDPMAEGPVIQRAMERALAHNVTVNDVFAMVQEFRQTNQKTPIILMGYLNPIEQMGYAEFAEKAQKAGVDGTIIVDLPPEESVAVMPIWQKYNLYPIFLCSPTTTELRMKHIVALAKGYLYYVSIKGVTGSNSLDVNDVRKKIMLRKTQTTLPILVGFGIKSPDNAKQISAFSDGIVVGAQLIECINDAYHKKTSMNAAAKNFLLSLKNAMNSLNEQD